MGYSEFRAEYTLAWQEWMSFGGACASSPRFPAYLSLLNKICELAETHPQWAEDVESEISDKLYKNDNNLDCL